MRIKMKMPRLLQVQVLQQEKVEQCAQEQKQGAPPRKRKASSQQRARGRRIA